MNSESAIKLVEHNDETPFLTLPEKGWASFRISPASDEFLASFDDLAFDQYAPQCHRYRRFSQFKVTHSGRKWLLNLLPHRPFIQPAQYNKLIGGTLRNFEPLKSDMTAYINEVFSFLEVDPLREYHLDAHQYRVYALPESNGISVPEGAHRDGQEYVAILVFRRHAITGAEMSLHELGTNRLIHRGLVDENSGVVLDDEKMTHDVSNIAATGDEKGYRDYVVLNINRWENRRYGEEFERRLTSS